MSTVSKTPLLPYSPSWSGPTPPAGAPGKVPLEKNSNTCTTSSHSARFSSDPWWPSRLQQVTEGIDSCHMNCCPYKHNKMKEVWHCTAPDLSERVTRQPMITEVVSRIYILKLNGIFFTCQRNFISNIVIHIFSFSFLISELSGSKWVSLVFS